MAHLILQHYKNALSEGRSQNLTYFVFDLLFADGQDLRTATLVKQGSAGTIN
jgi:ATP-dependent DNA ligase